MIWNAVALCAPGPDDLAAYKAAGARLLALIQAAQERGEPAQLKQPEVMDLIIRVSDEARVLGEGSYEQADLGVLFEICNVVNKASVSLALFDLKERVTPTMTPLQIQTQIVSAMNRNIPVFQDELKELQPFLIRCLAKQVEPLTQFVASLKPAELTDIRREGLVQARSSFLQMYVGALQAANDPRYRDDYKVAVLTALSEAAVDFVSVIQLPERKQLRESMQTIGGNTGQSQVLLFRRIADALENPACEGLCAVR